MLRARPLRLSALLVSIVAAAMWLSQDNLRPKMDADLPIAMGITAPAGIGAAQLGGVIPAGIGATQRGSQADESGPAQPESWWHSAFQAETSLPSRVLKKVAVGPGDTLMRLLSDAGAEPEESHQAIAALNSKFNPRRLRIGQEITLTFERLDSETLRLDELALAPSVEREVSVVRNGDSFRAQEVLRAFDMVPARITGEIEDSLYNAGIEAGLPMSVLSEFIRLFSFDVDFQREIQPGDGYEVFFERHLDEQGRAVKSGRILAASLTLSGRQLRYFQFQPRSGDVDYFNAQGQSVKKALLRTPIDGAKLTSGFGVRRHPIMGYTLMHRGVDFGAPVGTPIQAAGDGVVEQAGWNGAYGNYIRVKHGNGYSTAYAHLSRLGVKAGQRVRQGQILGAVGTTGRSTGPHLHYEVVQQGRQVNPMNVRFPSGQKLEGAELERFRRHMAQMEDTIRRSAPLTPLNSASLD